MYLAATTIQTNPLSWSTSFLFGIIVGMLIMAWIKR